MITLRKLYELGIICASWAIGYGTTLVIGDGMSSVFGFAVIVGWWFSAYCASVFRLSVLASLYAAIFYFVLFGIAAIGEQTWFYRDIPSLTLVSAIGVGFAQSFVISSPVLMHALFTKIVGLAHNRCPN